MNVYMRGVQFIQNYLNELQNNNQGEQVCSDGVQSITPRCNDSQSSIGKNVVERQKFDQELRVNYKPTA